jgi:hypothetical protein
MLTVDDIGRDVAKGTITPADAVRLFQEGDEDGDVVVYPAMNLTEGEETWQQVEELGTGSTLFADLRRAGATDDQMDEIGTQIVRLREAGRTFDKVYGWKTTD